MKYKEKMTEILDRELTQFDEKDPVTYRNVHSCKGSKGRMLRRE